MQAFIQRHYHLCLYGLVFILMVLSFLIGREEGSAVQTPDVVLSCTDDVLSALAIPVLEESTKKVATTKNKTSSVPTVLAGSASAVSQGKFLGSKNGTKYYTPDCSGAKRIKPENYVWFIYEEDAKLQGYTPAEC